jgi:hypothetical protein
MSKQTGRSLKQQRECHIDGSGKVTLALRAPDREPGLETRNFRRGFAAPICNRQSRIWNANAGGQWMEV